MTLLCTFREANVATVTGDAFGNPDCIRFLMPSEEILKEALKE
jgi:aspartate aminotransferase